MRILKSEQKSFSTSGLVRRKEFVKGSFFSPEKGHLDILYQEKKKGKEELMKEVDMSFTPYLKETFEMMNETGLLLASGDMDKSNVMAIGWGTAGIIWGKPVFVVLVRPSRYTYGLIEKIGQFTVNVPFPEMEEVVSFCGTVSGRSYDKFKEKNLTAVPGKKVKCPAIRECSISYECRVVHKNDVIPVELFPDIPPEYYPQGDYHRVYFGEILAAYKGLC